MCSSVCVCVCWRQRSDLKKECSIQSGFGFLLTSALTLFLGRGAEALGAVPVVQVIGGSRYSLFPAFPMLRQTLVIHLAAQQGR